MNSELTILDQVADSDNTAICGGFQRFQWVARGNWLKWKRIQKSIYFAVKQRQLKEKGAPISDLCSSSWSRNEFYMNLLYRTVISGIK